MTIAAASQESERPPRVHLSVVATSRNDDHGGSLLARMQHFVDGLVEQARRHRLAVELILVEWNPPPTRPPLAEALSWPAHDDHCEIRIITVPPERHTRLKHGSELPLFQMIAKNVGIRRARGRYVLATNIDILFSDSIMRYLRDELEPGHLYRADRCDVPTDVPRGVSFDRILTFCHRETFRINTIGRTLIKSAGGWRDPTPSVPSRLPTVSRHLSAALVSALRWSRNTVRGWLRGLHSFAQGVGQSVGEGVRQGFVRGVRKLVAPWPYRLDEWRRAWRQGGQVWRRARRHRPLGSLALAPGWLRRMAARAARRIGRAFARRARAIREACGRLTRAAQGAGTQLAYLARVTARQAIATARALALIASALTPYVVRQAKRLQRRNRLFTNACGDFTLLSRDDWFRLRGYPEWEIFSWHVDSVLLYQANRSGIREVYAGRARKIFHIEHGRGSGYTPEGVAELFARLDAKGVPYLTWPDFLTIVEGMDSRRRDGEAVLYNTPDWGLANDLLPETVITMPPAHLRTGT
jgi:hypothetical protein